MRAFHARDWGSNPHSSTLTLIVFFSQGEDRVVEVMNFIDYYSGEMHCKVGGSILIT
jgi:hypothetical protein